jgi:serine/threonine-protein kinase HipA
MRLLVCLEGVLVGTLEAVGSRVQFQYTQSWLQETGGYPLSLSLPLVGPPASGSAVVNFLWGLLPDNELTLGAWGRQFQVSARNPVALLAHVGEDCAGAVQFVREERLDAVLTTNRKSPEVEWMSSAQLEQRIQHLSRDAGATRESALEGQFSLSGAQAKTALHFDTGRKRWGIPKGRTPTTHILKPATNGFEGFAENEHFCLALARRVGLASANTEWRMIGDVPTLIAERYDRIQLSGVWHRLHQEDGCQALGVNPASKYENEGGPGFPQLMSLLASSDDPASDRDRLMKTACFVYLLAATDAHSKNYSFLHTRGEGRPSMRLAPLYDIASAWPYPRRIPPQKMKLAMRVGRHYRVQEIQLRHFAELAKACSYPEERLHDSLRNLAEALPDEALAVARSITTGEVGRAVIDALVDKLGGQCRQTLRRFAAVH